MKNKKILIFLLLGLVILLVAATVLYDRLGAGYRQDNLVVPGDTEGVTTTAGVGSEETSATEEKRSPALDFTAYDRDGKAVRLSDHFGKPIVLNFWASWCGPCKSEMPEFDAKYKELGEEVIFLMVNMTDGRETQAKAQAYLDEMGFSFPVLFDLDSSAAIIWQVYSLPTTYFIDRQGNVAAYAKGAIDGDTLQRGIDMILP